MPLAIHKTFDKKIGAPAKTTLYVSDGEELNKYQGKKIDAFIESLKPSLIIRPTTVNACDATLLELDNRGVELRYAHWHSLGFEKGLDPAEIVTQYALAPSSLFRKFTPRHDITNLRQTLALRNAILQCQGDAVRRIKQVARGVNLISDDQMKEDDQISGALSVVKRMGKELLAVDGVSLEKQLAEQAKQIPECVLFNKIAGIKSSWVLASSIVSASGGFDRFDEVASVWHYYGMHVVDGKAPKKKAGTPMDWSPNGRKALYMLGDVIIKATEGSEQRPREANPWRAVFDQFREQEHAAHEAKCGCKFPDGHSTSRARRKVVKEIMKQFFLAVKGETYQQNHCPTA